MTQGFDIDELERLLAAATPGEWFKARSGKRMSADYSQPFGLLAEHDGNHCIVAGLFGDTRGGEPSAGANAALIVAARNSLPAMLTEIRELRAENARLKDALDEDGLAEIITDTLDMDWQPRWAAQAIRRAALGEPQ